MTRLVIGNIMEVCLPWLKEWWAAKKLDKEVKDMRSPAEIENERLEYVQEQWRQFVCAAVSVFECGIARLRVLRVVFVQVRRVGNALADSSCTNTQLRNLQRLQ